MKVFPIKSTKLLQFSFGFLILSYKRDSQNVVCRQFPFHQFQRFLSLIFCNVSLAVAY